MFLPSRMLPKALNSVAAINTAATIIRSHCESEHQRNQLGGSERLFASWILLRRQLQRYLCAILLPLQPGEGSCEPSRDPGSRSHRARAITPTSAWAPSTSADVPCSGLTVLIRPTTRLSLPRVSRSIVSAAISASTIAPSTFSVCICMGTTTICCLDSARVACSSVHSFMPGTAAKFNGGFLEADYLASALGHGHPALGPGAIHGRLPEPGTAR